jgi:hypothetical protein
VALRLRHHDQLKQRLIAAGGRRRFEEPPLRAARTPAENWYLE